jgi:hypothetical protein
VKKDDQF